MILSGLEIKKRMDKGDVVIAPFEEKCVGPNSYDVHLGDELFVYDLQPGEILDPERMPQIKPVPKISKESVCPGSGQTEQNCWLLEPGKLYLGSTREYTETRNLVPMIEGRSSIGRLGVFVHVTAGFGDVGFKGNWTLEIAVIHPIVMEVGTRIAQLFYHQIEGEFQEYKGRYLGDRKPTPSRLKKL